MHKLVIHIDYRGNRIASLGVESPSPSVDCLNIIPEGVTLTLENKGHAGIAPVAKPFRSSDDVPAIPGFPNPQDCTHDAP